MREPLNEDALAAVEARSERARTVRWPVRGDMVWSVQEARAVWECAQDVPVLLDELRSLRLLVDELG